MHSFQDFQVWFLYTWTAHVLTFRCFPKRLDCNPTCSLQEGGASSKHSVLWHLVTGHVCTALQVPSTIKDRRSISISISISDFSVFDCSLYMLPSKKRTEPSSPSEIECSETLETLRYPLFDASKSGSSSEQCRRTWLTAHTESRGRTRTTVTPARDSGRCRSCRPGEPARLL